jgi:hypothetical protein
MSWSVGKRSREDRGRAGKNEERMAGKIEIRCDMSPQKKRGKIFF